MILVTGGTGLVGTHILIELLRRGNKVKAIKRKSSKLSLTKRIFKYYKVEHLFNNIIWVDADILDTPSLEKAMQGIEIIYHSAALISYNKKKYTKMYNVNVVGTANIVNVALSLKVKKIGFISSIATLGHSKTNNYDENNKWQTNKNNSYYSVTKYAAEKEIYRGIQEGLDAVIVNPGIIFGPSSWSRSSTSIFKKVFKGFKFYPPGSSGFVDARDVSKGIIQLTESNISAERYIMVGENLSFKYIFNEMALAFNKPAPKIKASKFMVNFTWIFAKIVSIITLKPPFITKDTALATIRTPVYNNSKIKTAIDFKFTSVKDSIENTATFLLLEQQIRNIS